MPQRYQLILHASGFHVPEEGQDPIIGFVTVRRVMAMNQEEAASLAKAELLDDPKILSMIEQTRLSTGTDETCKVEVDECFPIGWLRWTFSPLPTRLLLYSAEQEEGGSAQ